MREQDLVRIFNVSSSLSRLGFRVYIIHSTKVARPDVSVQLQTVNAWAASLCQQAKQSGRPIVVEHEQTKYGPTLRAAHFLERVPA